MSKSNPVHLWRFGRTRALFLPQKSLNRAKTGVLNGTPKIFPGLGQGVLTIHKTQLARINWKIKSIFYGLATRGLYFLKKSDAKRPFFPPCRNWPICHHKMSGASTHRQDFNYDGLGPDAFFFAGTSGDQPSANGDVVCCSFSFHLVFFLS